MCCICRNVRTTMVFLKKKKKGCHRLSVEIIIYHCVLCLVGSQLINTKREIVTRFSPLLLHLSYAFYHTNLPLHAYSYHFHQLQSNHSVQSMYHHNILFCNPLKNLNKKFVKGHVYLYCL